MHNFIKTLIHKIHILYRFGLGFAVSRLHKVDPSSKKTQFSNRTIFQWKTGLLLFLAFPFISCEPPLEHTSPSEAPSPVLQMDPEERGLIVTNDLFAAIIDNQSQEVIEEILLTPNNDLSSLNKKGDTPLGVAIQFRRKELAVFFLEKLQCEDLYHQNNKGESYIYLSAQYGYHELIQLIADKCYERKKTWTTLYDYEFSDLDPETHEGERAIHIAYDSTVMEALHEEYWRGMYEFPWRAFYKTNNKEETFFHTAVKDGRNSVMEWGVKLFCHENSWEKSDHFYQHIPADFLRHTWHMAQTYAQTITNWSIFHITQLINFQDKEKNTALHLAAQPPLNLEAIRLISNCRWTDYNLDNSLGNTALQEFLNGLDKTIPNHEEKTKETFLFLIKQATYLKQVVIRMTHIAKRVNHQNHAGDSSLHMAARLADEFFYNELKKHGDIYLLNKEEQTPKAIFESKRPQLQREKQP